MKQTGHLNPSEETGTGCPVTSKYGRTPPNKHGGVGRQQQQQQHMNVKYTAKVIQDLCEMRDLHKFEWLHHTQIEQFIQYLCTKICICILYIYEMQILYEYIQCVFAHNYFKQGHLIYTHIPPLSNCKDTGYEPTSLNNSKHNKHTNATRLKHYTVTEVHILNNTVVKEFN